jgi:hypothetical protein
VIDRPNKGTPQSQGSDGARKAPQACARMSKKEKNLIKL